MNIGDIDILKSRCIHSELSIYCYQIGSGTHKETSESSPEDERNWNVNTNKYPQAAVTLPNKITPEDLANEMLWLRLDQNYLMTEKEAITKVT